MKIISNKQRSIMDKILARILVNADILSYHHSYFMKKHPELKDDHDIKEMYRLIGDIQEDARRVFYKES